VQAREFLHANFSEIRRSRNSRRNRRRASGSSRPRFSGKNTTARLANTCGVCASSLPAKRISASSDSLNEIAHAAGFTDQSHFARTFKTHTGLTPGEYRKFRVRVNCIQKRFFRSILTRRFHDKKNCIYCESIAESNAAAAPHKSVSA
jgi:AraC-like DNA-binding protein